MALTPQGNPKYLKMRATENVKSETLTQFVKQSFASDVTIVNDGFSAYKKLAETRSTLTMKFDPDNNPDHMKCIHVSIAYVSRIEQSSCVVPSSIQRTRNAAIMLEAQIQVTTE